MFFFFFLYICMTVTHTQVVAENISQDKINSKEEFEQTLFQLQEQTQFWVTLQGAILKVEGLWNEDKPNASAGQKSATESFIWTVSMNGGLARNPYITKDAFIMTYCHELGHHFGGFPFFKDTVVAGMAVEGQADYYSSFCLKELWRNELEENKYADFFVTPKDRIACDQLNSPSTNRTNLCYRIMNAIRSKEKWYASYDASNPGKFDGPKGPDVKETNELHPNHKCRIETMIASNYCPVSRLPYIIPGKSFNYDAHSREAELSSAQHSCMEAEGIDFGYRPRCWFAPKVDILAGIDEVNFKEVNGDMDNVPEPGETFEMVGRVKNYSNSHFNKSVFLKLAPSSQYQIQHAAETDISKTDPQETIEVKSAVFKISSELKCGESLYIDFEFINDWNTEKQSKMINLGKVEKRNRVFTQNNKVKIPDINSFGKYGVSSLSIKDEEDLTYDKAFLKVDVSHKNLADLVGYIVSPSGNRYLAFEKRSLINFNQNNEIVVLLRDEPLNGRWVLEIRDLIQNNTGVLNSWELTFGKSQCFEK